MQRHSAAGNFSPRPCGGEESGVRGPLLGNANYAWIRHFLWTAVELTQTLAAYLGWN